MTDRDVVLDAVQTLVRPAILADGRWSVDSCILTTRVAYEVCKALGVDSRAMTVELRILNAPLAAAWAATKDPATLTQEAVPDGHAIYIGTGLEPGGRRPAMHVILLADHDLLDLSLDQAARPAWGLQLEPVWIRLDDAGHDRLLAGEPVSLRLPDGTVLIYLARLHDLRYTASPNWGRRDRILRRRIVGHVIRRIREKVGAEA